MYSLPILFIVIAFLTDDHAVCLHALKVQIKFSYLCESPTIKCRYRHSVIGPIPWGHSGPLCHALSLSSSLSSLSSLASWTSMRGRRATVQWRQLVNWREAARCGEWAQHFSLKIYQN